jgi:hypothetical protein
MSKPHINLISGFVSMLDGYGGWTLETTIELIKLGYPARHIWHTHLKQEFEHTPPALLPHIYNWSGLTIQLLPGNVIMDLPRRQWGLSMHEDDTLPRGWAANINRNVERLIVPNDYWRDVFCDGGVKVPVHIVPGGVNTDRHLPLPPRHDKPFTFLVLGDRAPRKGTEVAINALRRWFPRDKNVRLLIKHRPGQGVNYNLLKRHADNRIDIWCEDVDDMSDVFAEAHCFVYPSYGDGQGLTPLQATAHGIPTIAPDHTGLKGHVHNWATEVLTEFTRPKSHYYECTPRARWFKPTIEETGASMRWIYENYDTARQEALVGREWLVNNYTWRHSVQKLHELIQEYAA